MWNAAMTNSAVSGFFAVLVFLFEPFLKILSPGHQSMNFSSGSRVSLLNKPLTPVAFSIAFGIADAAPSIGSSPNSFRACRPVFMLKYSQMNYQEIITIEPGKRGGRPCIRHMRIAVADVLGWLAAGMSNQEILSDYPELTEEDIRACLAYAADRERRVMTMA
jgi:uncharacterized protein (DUF433 family)